MHLTSAHGLSSHVHSGKFLGKTHKFSSHLLEYLIPLQLVLIFVHQYIPSGMVNACATCFTQTTDISLNYVFCFVVVVLFWWVDECFFVVGLVWFRAS